MAQPATHPKIEELRFKLKTDPKSRLFYQLAEELRRAGEFNESEQVLRNGLLVYPTYLAAWVSLGRVLREQKNEEGAVEALNKALQLDPGNVVAARLLADAYLALGQKVEAIKKYKLVLALLPSDEELRGTIERIDRELRPAEVAAPEAEPEPEVAGGAAGFSPPAEEDVDDEDGLKAVAPQETVEEATPFAEASTAEAAVAPEEVDEPAPFLEESPFDRTLPPFEEEMQREIATADVEPMSRAHSESPFEEPVNEFTAASMSIESPLGMHIAAAPLAAEVAAPVVNEEELPPIDDTPSFGETDDVANTITMADLYVRQGLVDDARHIYENILARHPGNGDVRAKLQALAPRVNRKVATLERWLAKVSRKEVGRV
jgi:tetratricopeptide (TPR) repeat protein